MHALKWGVLVCAVLIAIRAYAGSEIGDYSDLPADLAKAAVAYDIAQFTSNRTELQRLLADDYSWPEPMAAITRKPKHSPTQPHPLARTRK